MPRTEHHSQTAWRFCFADGRTAIPIFRILALVAVMLLPVQMRAGAADAHPHALLHLMFDARDGAIDHHASAHGDEHDVHGEVSAERAAHAPASDLPEIGESGQPGGGWAILAAVVMLMVISAEVAARIWLPPQRWDERLPALEPPPPRGIGS